MAEPRDIGLSIRLKPRSVQSDMSNDAQESSRRAGVEEEQDGLEDMFDEIGMEYLDEASLPEDDDERRKSCSAPISSITLIPHSY